MLEIASDVLTIILLAALVVYLHDLRQETQGFLKDALDYTDSKITQLRKDIWKNQ